VEPESEFQVEQVQWTFEEPQASSCEDANIVVIKADLFASKPPSLSFVYLYILLMILDCALGRRSWIDTLVALRLLSCLSLLIIWLDIGR
jgi:hypothetical protein